MTDKRELRHFHVELRTATEGEEKPAAGRTITGYAAVFNSLSEDLGGWRERIMPGAFAGVLGDDVRGLFNHDVNCVLGRTKSGTLKLTEDETGLRFECSLPDTECAEDVAALMDRGDIDQCSFAFTVAAGGTQWEEMEIDGSQTVVRTITKIARLYDVSVVTYPAYPETSADIRSKAEILNERPNPHGASAELIRTRFRFMELQ